jgi:glycosyltransferase involved in cell wall biosynthesis
VADDIATSLHRDHPPPLTGGHPILFVSHQASRTGAPHVLLHLLRWARRYTDLSFHVLLLRGGPLEPEFRAIADVTVLTDVPFGPELTLAERVLATHKSMSVSRAITTLFRLRLRHLRGVGVVYLNSVCSVPALRFLPSRPRVVITHVHELRMGIDSALSPSIVAPLADADRRDPLRSTDLFIAAADCVTEELVARGIPAGRIRRHHEFIDVERTLASPDRSADARAALGLRPSTRVIVGSGTIEWRKGPDLFVHLARTIVGRRPDDDLYYLWVGGGGDDNAGSGGWTLLDDVRRSGLARYVGFVPEHPVPTVYYRLADVFVLTSREDPLPLVSLEASLLGKPVVSFDSGGMREFLSGGAGFVVPYLDVEAMADAVEALLDDPSRRRWVGETAAARVRERHDVMVAAPRLLNDVIGEITARFGEPDQTVGRGRFR